MSALFKLLGAVLALIALAAPVAPLRAQSPAESQATASDLDSAAEERLGASGLALPRFVSLRAPKVNLRTGPGVRYPIDWEYNRAGLPLEVLDEFETWRQVRDWEGSVGWVHQSMLSGDRKVMVRDKQRLLRSEPDPAAPGIALLAPGVIAKLERCTEVWCRIEVQEKTGWLRRIDLYGLYPDETVR